MILENQDLMCEQGTELFSKIATACAYFGPFWSVISVFHLESVNDVY